jgi:peroxiredoxin Q/BCP
MTKPEQESRSSGRLAARGVQKAAVPSKKTKAAAKPALKPEEEQVVVEGNSKGTAAKWVTGKEITAITLKDQTGTEVNLKDLAKGTGFVIFFVPKANTPGCNKQACLFRDEYQKFADAGFKVILPLNLGIWVLKRLCQIHDILEGKV